MVMPYLLVVNDIVGLKQLLFVEKYIDFTI